MKKLIFILALMLTTSAFAGSFSGTYYGSTVFMGLWGSGSCKVKIRKVGNRKYSVRASDGSGSVLVGNIKRPLKESGASTIKIKSVRNKLIKKAKLHIDADGFPYQLIATGLGLKRNGLLTRAYYKRFTCRRLKVGLSEYIYRMKQLRNLSFR